MSDDILDLIDGALDDWTSDDAMRWTPEPEKVGPEQAERDLLPYWGELDALIVNAIRRAMADIDHLTECLFPPRPPEMTPLTDESKTLLRLSDAEPSDVVGGIAQWPTGNLPACFVKRTTEGEA